MSQLIGQTIGPYRVIDLLGEGGMATVYRALNQETGLEVALKVIDHKLAHQQDFIKRFIREVRTARELKHPHIVGVLDAGHKDSVLFLAMPLISGGNLARMIRRSPLSLTATTRLIVQLASAIDYAHQKGVIHRDLKPQNVLMDDDSSPETANAFLSDFGIAKLQGEQATALTGTSMAMGTVSYMAPEQFETRDIDGRADIYALGIMLFEMLAGVVPFQGDLVFNVMKQHLNDMPPSLHLYRPDIHPTIDDVLLYALAKQRDDRFSTATELADALCVVLEYTEQWTPQSLHVPWQPSTDFSTTALRRAPTDYEIRVDELGPDAETTIAPAQTERRRFFPVMLVPLVGIVACAATLVLSNGTPMAGTPLMEPTVVEVLPTATLAPANNLPPARPPVEPTQSEPTITHSATAAARTQTAGIRPTATNTGVFVTLTGGGAFTGASSPGDSGTSSGDGGSTSTQRPPTTAPFNTAAPSSTPRPPTTAPFNTAAPSSTPRPPTTAPFNTAAPSSTQRPPTNTPLPTNTQRPSATPTTQPIVINTATPRPTNTPEPTNTNTPLPTNTLRPTDTPEPPTNTPEPTNTLRPTDTPEPPTDTPQPPTDTAEPPTNTPEPTVEPTTDGGTTVTPESQGGEPTQQPIYLPTDTPESVPPTAESVPPTAEQLSPTAVATSESQP